MPQTIDVARLVQASPEAIWSILTDIPSAAQTLSGVESVEILTPGEYLPGYRWKETRKMFGMSATEELMVREVDPPRSTVIYAASNGTEYLTTFTLTPESGGTELRLTFEVEVVRASMVTSLVNTVFGGVVARSTRKMLRKDLDDIAAAAEAL